MNFERLTLSVNGLNVECIRAGQGETLVLFLHGFPDRADSMKPLMETFDPDRHTLVAPYMRGYAPTDIPDRDHYYLFDLANDAFELLEEFDRDSTFLVGHDWGAPTAYSMANLYPEVIDGLIGMAVPPLRVFARNIFRFPAQLRRSWYMFFFQLPEVPELFLRRDNFQMIDRFYQQWSPNLETPEQYTNPLKDTFRDDNRLRAALGYYRCLFRGGLEVPEKFWKSVWLSLRQIMVPGLVLRGGNDGCIAPELFDGTVEAFGADGQLGTMEDAGHFMHLEDPAGVGRRIRNYVKK